VIDTTQLSYLVKVRWDNPAADLGEELSCKTTLPSEHVDEMSAAELVALLTQGAIDTWRWKIEQRIGKAPPADAPLVITLDIDAATGKPVAHLCTMVEEGEAAQPTDR